MKSFVKSFLLCLIVCALLPLSAQAADIKINAEPLEVDTPAVIEKGRILAPFRAIAEGLGCEVRWDAVSRTAYSTRQARGKVETLAIPIGAKEMVLSLDDGKVKKTIGLDVPAQIIEGRTYLPVRAFAEAFGAKVSWDAALNTALIDTEKDPDDEASLITKMKESVTKNIDQEKLKEQVNEKKEKASERYYESKDWIREQLKERIPEK